MGLIEKILALFFGSRKKARTSQGSITLVQAKGLLNLKISEDEAKIEEFSSKKLSEIRYLISSLANNASDLESAKIELNEGNKAYRQIVATSQKNLSRQLRALSGKIAAPKSANYASMQEYAARAKKAVATDLLPYWKNIALAKLMLKDEVKTIGENLTELHSALSEIESRIFSSQILLLREMLSLAGEIENIEAAQEKGRDRGVGIKQELEKEKSSFESINARIAQLKSSDESKSVAAAKDEIAVLERKKTEIIAGFNAQIAGIEKVLRRLNSAQAKSGLLQNEHEILVKMLSNPLGAILSDPRGEAMKAVLVKASELVARGEFSFKGEEKKKRLAMIDSFLHRDFFSDYFWELNKLESAAATLQKTISSSKVQSEILLLERESKDAHAKISMLESQLAKSLSGDVSGQLREKKARFSQLLSKNFGSALE